MRVVQGPWLVFFAGVPLLLAVVLLELLGAGTGPLLDTELEKLTGLSEQRFLPGQTTFVAIVTAHVAACAVAVMMAVDMLRRTPRSRPFTLAGIAVAALFVAALPLAAIRFSGNAVELTYGVYQSFFDEVKAAPAFTTAVIGGLTPLHLGLLLPSAFGIVAVAMMSAAANAQLRLFRLVVEGRVHKQVARIRQIHDRLKRCLYALGMVLVTSTVAASLFLHLPARLAAEKDSVEAPLLARFSSFASELSILWGLVFTLTLAAAVGLPLFLLQNRVRRALEPPPLGAAGSAQRTLLAESGIPAEGREQLKFLTALLAPLAAGPISNFLQKATLF